MRESKRPPTIREIMNTNVVSINETEDIKNAAKKLLNAQTNHLPVVNAAGGVVGIVTTYDISRSVVNDKSDGKVSEIMSKNVVTTTPDEVVDIAVMKLERNKISALPIVDENGHLVGLLNAVDLGKLVGKRWTK